jgi:CRP/FNR family transcriptional regulator, cyclic AMP receptor protein
MTKVIKGVDVPRETFKAGSVIFSEKDESRFFYILKSGEVDVFKNYGKPDQVLLATIPGGGRVLGELSAIDNRDRSATAIARTQVDAVKISAETIRWQLQQCPSWFRAIVHDLAERLRSADELLIKQGVNHASSVSSLKEQKDANAS